MNELPPVPAVYAMYGAAAREYVAYVGLADNLRRRVTEAAQTLGDNDERLEANAVGAQETRPERERFTVYADGSGTTGGPAGIGFVVLWDGLPFAEWRVPLPDATNQQAELRAATFALESLPEGQDVVLYSDSKYVVRNFNEYLPGWRERGWRTGGGAPVANLPHWEDLVAAVGRHRNVQLKWMRGHVVKCPTCSDNVAEETRSTEDRHGTSCSDEWHDHAQHNNRADRLAGEARQAARLAFA